VTYFAGIHDLAYCFQRLGGAGSAGYSQDWVGLGANLAAAAGKAAWYAKGQNEALKKALESVGKKILPTPTAIIDVTMVVVSVVDLLNGLGPPYKGDSLSTGVEQLANVILQLEAAIPDDRDWSGDAALAYTAQTEALRALVQTMQELDKQFKALVAEQGAKVQWAHNSLSILLFALVVAQGVALLLYLIPIFGPEISLLWQVVAALAAATTVVTVETLTLGTSSNVANGVDAVALEYGQVAENAIQSGTFGVIEVAGAEETRVSSFTEISRSMSGMSAFSKEPTVASLASLAGDSVPTEQRALLSALTETETPADGLPDAPDAEVPETPVATTPTTPTITLPTMAQVTQISGQAAKLSGHASQQMNLVNQTMGSVQQVASMGQQGQGAAPPAEDAAAEEVAPEPALAEAEGATGAASGAEAGERAPVEVATDGPEKTEDRGPAERIL
jgi:EspA/EspE family